VGKDKKKKHKKKHKKKDAVGTPQWTYEFTYTLPLTSFGSVSTGYGMVWSTYVPPVQVPQIFQDAFEDGELEP
jgi:hypothetical protein